MFVTRPSATHWKWVALIIKLLLVVDNQAILPLLGAPNPQKSDLASPVQPNVQ
jgi:hypothetical protein